MMSDVITLRSATTDDVAAMSALLVQLYQVEVPGVLHGPIADQCRFFAHLVAYDLAASEGGRYVAVDAMGTVVGCVNLRSPGSNVEVLLPPNTLWFAATSLGFLDTVGLLFSALRSSFTAELELAAGEYYIYSVVVDAAARGRGIGAAMMQQIEAVVRNRGGCATLLRVLVANESARHFYTRLGYHHVTRTPAYLDAITYPSEVLRKAV